jgi:disulfide bond formation protein DsbB
MAFMFAVTLLALVQLVVKNKFPVVRSISVVLLFLGSILIVEALRAFGRKRMADEDDTPSGDIASAVGERA